MLKPRIFTHMNKTGDVACPLCGTNEDAPVILVRIEHTERDGIAEAMQLHADCVLACFGRLGAITEDRDAIWFGAKFERTVALGEEPT